MSWTSNDPSIRATKSTAQYAREQEMNERIMARHKFKSIEEASKATGLSEEAIRNFKPVDQMTAEELIKAIDPSVAVANALQSALQWCPTCKGEGYIWHQYEPDDIDKDVCDTCDAARAALWDYDHRNDGR